MKTIQNLVFCSAVLAAGIAAADVRVGDHRDTVMAELGAPQASIEAGSFQLLTYERGRVELRSDVVTLVELVSPEEAAKRRLQAERQADAARVRAAERRAELLAEGVAILERSKRDSALSDSTVEQQVDYWRSFARSYPDVDASSQYLDALRRLEQKRNDDLRAAEQAQQIRELEARVAAAESRARDVEDRSRHSAVYYDSIYRPVQYVSSSACYVRPTPRIVRPACAPVVRPYSRRSSGVVVSIGGGTSACRTSYRSAFNSSGFYARARF